MTRQALRRTASGKAEFKIGGMSQIRTVVPLVSRLRVTNGFGKMGHSKSKTTSFGQTLGMAELPFELTLPSFQQHATSQQPPNYIILVALQHAR